MNNQNNIKNKLIYNINLYIESQQKKIDTENVYQNNEYNDNGLLVKLKEECSVQIDTLEPMTEFDCK